MPKKDDSKILKNDEPNVKLLKGFKDILPEDEKYWHFVLQKVLQVARDYNYSLISTPILEESRMFERTVGETSDIVSKEMFRFHLPKGEDNNAGGEEVVLRPEGTAPAVRAYIEHGMLNKPQPVKLWYFGPMFRYEKPQSGRYRQHHQWGFEVIGDGSPIIDAQVIIAMYSIYKSLDLDVVFSINSIGDLSCRPTYIDELVEYLEPRSRSLCTNCRKRAKLNPLRVLDCKEEKCQAVLEEAPQILDFLCEDCRNHFVAVLEYLDELDVPYALNPRLVRGFDYYSRTTFEAYLKDDYEKGSKLNSLGGGGRYDSLVEQLGGRPTSAAGAAGGAERIIMVLKDRNIVVPGVKKYDIFIAQLGEKARRKALGLFETLKEHGWSVVESLSKDGLSSQLEKSNQLGAQFTLILGQKEILDGTIIIRDMSSGIQEEVVYDKLILELEKRLSSARVINHIDESLKKENNLNIDNRKGVADGC